jgi:LAS superfamily LD-carboxypeptidase LdcB
LQAAKNRKRRRGRPNWRKLAVLGLVLVLVGYLNFGQEIKDQANGADAHTEVAVPESQLKLRHFTTEEFKAAYNSRSYPNTEPIETPPYITGNEEADARIRKIAEKRGYKLSAVPVSSIVQTGEVGLEGNDLIQPNALIAWQKLKEAAAKDGIKLKMTSAYRSIEYQRGLFVRRLTAAGVNVARVLEGYADDEIQGVLSRAAIPGYSRHHTGYTIDLSCNGVGLEDFINTNCYQWISKNNFENIKKYGWVPSYPEGANGVGPEPESWEYIWVGTTTTYE